MPQTVPPESRPDAFRSACVGRPKIVAIGIAPLGIISIGIVPMGVINASVVGMGILIAGVNVMGVWWVGMEGMGPYRLGSPSGQVHHHQSRDNDHSQGQQNLYAYPSRECMPWAPSGCPARTTTPPELSPGP